MAQQRGVGMLFNSSNRPKRPSLLNEGILSRHNTGANDLRKEVMDELKEQSLQFAEAQQAMHERLGEEEALLRSSLVAVVQRVFAVVDPCVAELNATVTLPDLKVSLTPPAVVTETLKYNAHREPIKSVSTFRGRISTSCLSVVIRGHGDVIDFYFLPADKVVGLSFAEEQYKPIMQFRAAFADRGIAWSVEGKPLSEQRLEKYSLIVFKHLIESTIDELKARTPARR